MTPQTTADLSDIMRAAEAPLRIVGGDSRGIAPEAGATLQTTGLAGIKAYQPGALTMVTPCLIARPDRGCTRAT